MGKFTLILVMRQVQD